MLKNRHAFEIKDSEGHVFVFNYGVNARREIVKRSKQTVPEVFQRAFALSPVTTKDEATGEEKTEVKPNGEQWDLDALCLLVSCCSVEPKLTEDDAGLLIDDVGVDVVTDIFGQKKQGSENPTTTSS